MPVLISLLRAVNVGGHNKIKMDALRVLYGSLGLRDAHTYVQSGNVVFRSAGRNSARLQKEIQNAIAGKFGCRPDVVLRSIPEWKAAAAANPFRRRPEIDPAKLQVMFLAGAPAPHAAKALLELRAAQEELKLIGRELFVYYPQGMGQSKLSSGALEKTLEVPGTSRNWNTVNKLLEMAEALEAAG